MIRGFFHPDRPDTPTPFIGAVVWIPSLFPDWRAMSFLVDTGAERTTIHPTDAMERLRIPRSTLERPPREWGTPGHAGGVGGSHLYYEIPAALGLYTDDGNADIRRIDVLVAPLSPENRNLPSLLGWDVLRNFELTTNWPKRLVRLEQV